jgi:hypothetical protein
MCKRKGLKTMLDSCNIDKIDLNYDVRNHERAVSNMMPINAGQKY